MNPLHWPRMVAALVPLTLAATVVAAPTVSASPACDGRFAVGGYPSTEKVPPGYQYIPTPGGIFGHENRGYNHGQTVGAHNLVQALDEYTAKCDGPIHVYGHSYGAAIVHTAIETIDRRPYAHRVHAHVTGNPRRPGGIEDTYAGWTILPGITFRGAGIEPRNLGSWRDDCNPHDGICRLPRLIHDPVGHVQGWIGYLFTGAHRY